MDARLHSRESLRIRLLDAYRCLDILIVRSAVGNVWFDREQGRLVYNIEDPEHHLLTAGAGVERSTEIDPAQKAARLACGSSPVSDEDRMHDFPVDEQWRLSASYLWKQSDHPPCSIGRTLAFVGNAPVEQTAQRVTVRGDYDTDFLAILGSTLRDRFLVAPIRPAHVRSAQA